MKRAIITKEPIISEAYYKADQLARLRLFTTENCQILTRLEIPKSSKHSYVNQIRKLRTTI